MSQKDDNVNIRDIIKEQYFICSQDYVYAIKRYAKIEHPIRGKIDFNLYPFQEKTLLQLQQHRFNIILKSRQMGISTLVASKALLDMIFIENYKVLIIATNQSVAKNLLHKVRVMYANLPNWMKPEVDSDNKLELSFKNGSSIKAVSASKTAGRSEALSLLIIDEAAFIEKIEDIWLGATFTLSTGGSAIILSTPNGVGNLFHKLWDEAEQCIAPEGLEPFNPIKLKWDLHPERDQKWRDQQDFITTPRQAAQECDCDFLSSGHTVVDGEIIKWFNENTVQEPLERRGIGGDYWIWAYPNYGRDYLIAADVARGDGSDYSAAIVLDIETMEQVAEYKGQLGTREFGKFLVQLGIEWNNALIAVENSNVGWDTVQEIIDQHYDNLFYSFKNDPYLDDAKHLIKAWDLKNKKDMVPGFSTTGVTRPIMISKVETYFLSKQIKVRSKRTMGELLVFKWINGKAQAASGYNDDLVMSWGMALFLRDTAIKLRNLGISITHKALGSISKGIYVPGKNMSRNSGMEQRMPNGQIESLKWLL